MKCVWRIVGVPEEVGDLEGRRGWVLGEGGADGIMNGTIAS
jgi:hypothetical protein